MPRYAVEVTLGSLFEEVEADNVDHAIDKAVEIWTDEAAEIIEQGTFHAERVESE